MTVDAQKIFDKLFSETKAGTASKADFWVLDLPNGGFPQNLNVISSDKKYAAKIYLGKNPEEDTRYINYAFSDPRNAFKGIDLIGNIELYYNESGIQIYNKPGENYTVRFSVVHSGTQECIDSAGVRHTLEHTNPASLNSLNAKVVRYLKTKCPARLGAPR